MHRNATWRTVEVSHALTITEWKCGDMNDIQQRFAQQGLVRPRNGRVLAGVCAGLGRRLGIAPWIARLLFVLLLMVIPGSQILIYPILWVLMPAEENPPFRPTPPSNHS